MLVVRTVLAASRVQGVGLFADEPIEKGQLVWVFDPGIDVLFPSQGVGWLHPVSQEYFRTHCVRLGSYYLIYGGTFAFVNHSDAPNLAFERPRLRTFATRDIARGEELTENYFDLCDDVVQHGLGF